MSVYKGDKLIGSYNVLTKKYINDQLELDRDNNLDILSSAKSAATAVQMPYDGIFSTYTSFNKYIQVFILDKQKQINREFSINANEVTSEAGTYFFNKGEWMYIAGTSPLRGYLRYYKKRDYTGR